MRIAIDTQSTIGRKTGIGMYTAQLLAALRAVAPGHDYIELGLGRDVVMRFDRRLRYQQFDVPRLAGRARADVLHVPGFDAPRFAPCPTVLTVHDLIGMLFPRNLPPVSRFYWSRWLPLSVRFADAVIADSEATRRDILRLLRLREERITVVPLGVEPRFHARPPLEIEAARARLQLPAAYVLFVGTLEPRKGIDTLVDAFAAVAAGVPHSLVLVGKPGWYWEPVARRIEQNRLGERVRVLGYVADDDMPLVYAGAAALALPSRYEGFGLPVLEAMASGVPVVTTRVSSLPEVAGDAALLVEPDRPDELADALRALLHSAELGRAHAARGLAQAGRFTWERTASATVAVYERVARRR